MDEKHAMLYPPLETTTPGGMRRDPSGLAAVSLGLPAEAPPSYDMAMAGSGSSSRGIVAALPAASNDAGIAASEPYTAPAFTYTNPQPYPSPRTTTTRSVVVEQPTATARATAPPAAIVMQPHQPYQPHQPQQQQQQHQQQPQLPTDAPMTVPLSTPAKLGPNPCAVLCPACGTCKTTRMQFTPNTRTHLCALLLCLVGWCCCACCVPYCLNSCRTGNHYCSKCNTFLGVFNPRDSADK